MPQANGEFVKVYLYLLRCANTGRELSALFDRRCAGAYGK